MYTDYQAEAHFLLATGEQLESSTALLRPAPDLTMIAVACAALPEVPADAIGPSGPSPRRPA